MFALVTLFVKWCVYDINHIYALGIEKLAKLILAVTKQLKQLQKKKPRKYSEVLTGFEPMIFAIQLQCSTDWATMYEALLEGGQEWVQFVPVIWREWNDVFEKFLF